MIMDHYFFIVIEYLSYLLTVLFEFHITILTIIIDNVYSIYDYFFILITIIMKEVLIYLKVRLN